MDIRNLLDVVIASFQPSPTWGTGWTEEERATLDSLREAFVTAGAERIERECGARWLQMSVRFKSDPQREEFLGARLAAFARRALATCGASGFFYMCKPPGVRLRFSGQRLELSLLAELRLFLEEERNAGRIQSSELGLYEAEAQVFGGETGMAIAHDFFTYDSLATLDLMALQRDSADPADPSVLSLTLLNHLIAQVAADRNERWDVWCNMEATGRIPPPVGHPVHDLLRTDLGTQEALLRDAIWRPGAILETLSPAEGAIAADYFRNNERIGKRLAEATKAGTLLRGPRRTFPFYFIFHWNRWRFPKSAQTALTYFMQALLDPFEVRTPTLQGHP